MITSNLITVGIYTTMFRKLLPYTTSSCKGKTDTLIEIKIIIFTH